MAEELYKVSPEEKELIDYEFTDENGIHRKVECVNEQKSGEFLISKEEYEKRKTELDKKGVDFSKKEVIDVVDVDSKDTGIK